MNGSGHEAEAHGPQARRRSRSAMTASPASPSPARHATVSMNDFAGSFRPGGTGRYSSSTAGRSIE